MFKALPQMQKSFIILALLELEKQGLPNDSIFVNIVSIFRWIDKPSSSEGKRFTNSWISSAVWNTIPFISFNVIWMILYKLFNMRYNVSVIVPWFTQANWFPRIRDLNS
jgi:hypothetical protein